MTTLDYNELARLGVATIYEASGRQGLVDVELHQIVPGSRVAGPARTVRCGQDDNLMVHAVLATVRPGEILVLIMPNPAPVALVGDLLATQALAQGVAGMLIDASVRDVEELRGLGLPIWARFIRVRGAAKHVLGAINEPVEVGGAQIRAGDVVIMDADGAVVVAAERAAAVLDAGLAREAKEADLRAKFQAGQISIDVYGIREQVASVIG
jgi:4-hydroxy-4-methyl-2-oxoglutarate aldolase